jgi:hypothetical protein
MSAVENAHCPLWVDTGPGLLSDDRAADQHFGSRPIVSLIPFLSSVVAVAAAGQVRVVGALVHASGGYVAHVVAAARIDRKSVHVCADYGRWPVQRAHRLHGAPPRLTCELSIVHAARRFDTTKHRFAHVAADFFRPTVHGHEEPFSGLICFVEFRR